MRAVLLAIILVAATSGPMITARADGPGELLVRVDDGFSPAAGGDAEAARDPAEADAAGTAAAEIGRLCDLLVAAADAHAVPEEFFIRLIWKESRFDPSAVSPKGAEGIAQFMPATARAWGLERPFEPAEALPASASFLRMLFDRFGHWGLAAMAYNAGEGRVDGFLSGGFLPYETRDYVYAITGRSAEFWRERRAREAEDAAAVATVNPHPPDPAADKPDDPQPLANGPGILPAAAGGVVPHPDAADGAPETVPPPRSRPDDLPVTPVDCPTLVTALGQARAAPRPPGGGGWAPWGAQVAGHTNPSVAMRQFARAQARIPEDLRATPPVVIARRVPGMGRRAVHAVQLGAASRAGAAALCRRIASAGAPCVVVRN